MSENIKKILFISNITNKISNFSYPSIVAAQSLGYEFHLAANLSGFTDDASKYSVTLHHIDLERNPLSLKNIKAYRQMVELIKKENIDVIHCNTPIGGILGRLCGKKENVPKIIYSAHGFHFYEGASLINNTFYKWAEVKMAHHTDAIITMNEEDFKAAQEMRLRNDGNVYFIPGVGVDTTAYQLSKVDNIGIKESLGLKEDDIVLIAMGDLIARKNYKASIEAIFKAKNNKLQFLICGKGSELTALQQLVKKLRLENQVHFLGFRKDVKDLLNIADIFLFTTYQEGLPRSMMEAMSAGLPCVASNVRGNRDLIKNGEGGFLCNPNDIDGFAKAINLISTNHTLRKEMGLRNLESIRRFDVENVKSEMKNIYEREFTL
ncbi:glycosyltransferase family 4 protein [Priestia aryabhattai]|uniref:glycosyltransferase family 4 protein n=1 Tax=Priestia aryabhattai TaxID=412384 RepID=UPI0005EC9A59|nr:glycosyltransferase family 4 protein [Priestia aryabhattai]